MKTFVDTLNFYNYNLSTSVYVSEILNDELNDASNLYDELCNAIKSADVVLIARVKYRKHVTPFWNSTLKDLRKADWSGYGRDPQGSQRIFITCNTKKLNANKRKQRRSAWEFERKEFDKLAYSNEINQEKFWRLLNNRARKKIRKAK
jgi:predicted metallo-beta-lactamase superfamily hydrolase